jgi:hypothetical protein
MEIFPASNEQIACERGQFNFERIGRNSAVDYGVKKSQNRLQGSFFLGDGPQGRRGNSSDRVNAWAVAVERRWRSRVSED